ncbi:DUF6456 domain-containing protein [Mesorhizobium sp. RP14(2022)]|uniref:DUF6456 domain-containing protein n=1 Tax=Mesorhizobium liriopis TaxID=2953882 RepID=A0ABT1C1B5_9HYPH|nr:DUF6456 domain-containing protein [Mesorhizobium liriopis]MCO6048618.1 DUF6456 domain-containing protein [Mesorhizobium liriopis]
MERGKERVLHFLRGGEATETAASGGAGTRLLERGGGSLSVAAADLDGLVKLGLIERAGGVVRLVKQKGDALGAQPRQVASVAVGGSAPARAAINLSESPLGSLMRRKTKEGEAFLSDAEFHAGERLRADFTRGQLMPRLGASWVGSVSSGKRGAGGGVVELTDAAMAARLRVGKALDAVGPELSGVLVDVCCFLKGLEQVESERGWPVRSAKIVLKTALGVLARHYRPEDEKPKAGVFHWGAADYRPKLKD